MFKIRELVFNKTFGPGIVFFISPHELYVKFISPDLFGKPGSSLDLHTCNNKLSTKTGWRFLPNGNTLQGPNSVQAGPLIKLNNFIY